MADNKEKLFTDFPPVSTEEWMEKVTADLKGADFDKKLVWRTSEGFKVMPFYRQEDIQNLKTTGSLPGEFPFVRGTKTNNKWFVRQEIEVTDVNEANKKALDILNKGVDAIGFSIPGDKISKENLAALLKGIQLDAIEVNFRSCQNEIVKLIKVAVEYFKSTGISPEKIQGSANYDPFSKTLRKGKEVGSIGKEIAELVALTSEFKNFRVIGVNAFQFNNAGSYISQELGFALAYGCEFLSQAVEAGVSINDAAKKIKFNFGVGSNYFMEIAKFRAARMLWADIVAAYQSTCDRAAKMQIHAFTSEWNQTVYDAHVNLLRSQTEAMSAAIAGVDSLTVLPFDNSYKKPDEFSERIARNQQLLLKEESHFDKIVDPSAGSYYLEMLTASIAEQAWKYFLTVEDKGGFYAALKEGYVQNEIKTSLNSRLSDIAKRKEILLGTNQFPNFSELAASKIEKTCGCCCGSSDGGALAALDFSRGAVQFEALRLATEKSGKCPKVFMLTIGNLAMRLARSQFSSNFFACAGYEIIDNLGFGTPEEGVEAARKVKADMIVICSSDEEYAEFAPKAFDALAGGKEIFVVAGAPECTEELKAKGITNFINMRSNVLETLQFFNKQLGIN
jgi:methylmalonyl-CoA mutase